MQVYFVTISFASVIVVDDEDSVAIFSRAFTLQFEMFSCFCCEYIFIICQKEKNVHIVVSSFQVDKGGIVFVREPNLK